MALSDLQVFSEYAYSTMTELLDYNVNLFNAATRGGFLLRSAAHQGDYSDVAVWAKISGLVRRRNAYGTGAVTEKVLTQLRDTSVKVAAGIAPVRIDPSMMLWIQKSPEEAGVVVGKQMAGDSLGDMVNTGLLAFRVAMQAQTAVYHDGSAAVASLGVLNTARAKLGDRAEEVVCWVLHSKQLFDIYGAAITNANLLFSFGNVRVTHDGFGNPFVVTDSTSLVDTTYLACGLVPGAIMVDQNNDFIDNVQTINGDENIKRTYQAEWSYNLGLKGFQWDKTNGGASPNNTALGTATNWDKYATSNKDLAGVLLRTL
ncbi:MAG TPA: major capsid protein [Candidatus Methanoperedens sp.]